MTTAISFYDRIAGVLVGTAVGDAIGLPAEGISRQRNKKLYHGIWHHRFLPGTGMISDDTEHTIFVSQCLLASSDDPDKFGRRFAWCLRWWFFCLPAGVGFATLRAICKLWVGFNHRKSGIFSAGNGPAMRSAIIGAFFFDNPESLDRYVKTSTQITHTDPKALTGSRAVALLTAWCFREDFKNPPEIDRVIEILHTAGEDAEWQTIIYGLNQAWNNNLSVLDYAHTLGQEKGVSGYIYHSVPVAIYAWYHHFGKFKDTLSAVFDCGGDSDTVGAITGALCGSLTGVENIPRDWVDGIRDWPRGMGLLENLAESLTQKKQGTAVGPVSYLWPAVPLRNLFFLIIVLLHGFRRLLPPY